MLKWDHTGLEWGPYPVTGVLIRRPYREIEETYRAEGLILIETGVINVTWSQGMARIASNHQPLERDMEQIFPQSLQKEPGLLTTWFWTSSFQNFNRIHFCCFKPLSWWFFVTAALGNEYKHPVWWMRSDLHESTSSWCFRTPKLKSHFCKL